MKNILRSTILAAAIVGAVTASSAATYSDLGYGAAWEKAIEAGDGFLAKEEYSRAFDQYEKATRLTPHAAEGFMRLASTSYRWGVSVPARRQDLWSRAIKAADRARFLDPYSGEAAFLSAVLRYRTGDYQGAVEVYSSLMSIRKGDAGLYLDLAVAARRLGDNELSILALRTAKRIEPTSERVDRVARELFP